MLELYGAISFEVRADRFYQYLDFITLRLTVMVVFTLGHIKQESFEEFQADLYGFF